MTSLQKITPSNNLTVEQKGSRLVIDSRIIAHGLGIEHRAFMQTIKKYEPRIEQRFGVITFEMSKPLEGSQGGRPEKFAWLTEEQATFLMTLSRNTDQVVDCKANLVDAFSQARQVIPQLTDENETLRLMLALERERNLGRQLDNTMLQMHGDRIVLALRGQSDIIVEKETIVTEIVEPDTGKSTKILTANQLKRVIKDRTGQNLKSAKQFTDALRKSGRDDLLVPVRRSGVTEYVPPDKINEAIQVVYGKVRQGLIGE
jgi:phage regulator Rha-like protein